MSRIRGRVAIVGRFSRFFFLDCVGEKSQIFTLFCSRSDVIADQIGRVNLNVGDSVSLEVVPDPRGKNKFVASKVRNENPEVLAIDPAAHREFGTIHVLNKHHRGSVFGTIRRGEEGADLIPFRASDIVSEGADDIQVGDFLEFGIATHEGREGQIKYHATDIHTCEQDAPPEETAPLEDGQVYTAVQKRMTLRELISLK